MIVDVQVPRHEYEALKPFLSGYEAMINKDQAILRIDPDELVLAREALHQQEQEDFYSSVLFA